MDLRKIGIVLILIGIVFTVMFIGNEKIFVPALTITVLGFFITVVGFVSEIRKRKIINRAEKIFLIVVLLAYAINISSSHIAPCGVWCFGYRTARRGLSRNGGRRQGG